MAEGGFGLILLIGAVIVIGLSYFGFGGTTYVVGIDLGTSFSVIAIKENSKNSKTESRVLFHHKTKKLLVPSVIAFRIKKNYKENSSEDVIIDNDSDASDRLKRLGEAPILKELFTERRIQETFDILVGDDAVEFQHQENGKNDSLYSNVIYHSKRFIGRTYSQVDSEINRRPFRVISEVENDKDTMAVFDIHSDDDGNGGHLRRCKNSELKENNANHDQMDNHETIPVRETRKSCDQFSGLNNTFSISPIQVGAMIISELLASLPIPVHRARFVVTVPVSFDSVQRDATEEVLKGLGVPVSRIIDEPTAAALAYNLHHVHGIVGARSKNTMVFDLGGGTLDVSILSIVSYSGSINVLATKGDDRLGGQDFDKVVADYIEKECHYYDILGAEQKKKELVGGEEKLFDEDRQWYVYRYGNVAVPICEGKYLTTETFREISYSLLDRIYDLVHESLDLVGLEPKYITDVVFVGGSTRSEIVRQTVIESFDDHHPVFHDHMDPDTVVALGASNIHD